MGTHKTLGFTVIETMLFLSITGMLIAGLLIGTSASINNQRYNDAVETFKEMLQNQYAELGAVRNDRANTYGCVVNGTTVSVKNDGKQIRGQSDCVITGRYMVINGPTVTVRSVLASKNTSASGTTDIARLKSGYAYGLMDDISTDTLQWGTSFKGPERGLGADPALTKIALLFLRSPETGKIYTFSANTPSDTVSSTTITNMINANDATPGQGARTLCLESDGLFVGGAMGIYLNARAAGSSAVEVRSDDMSKQLDGTGAAQCEKKQ